MRNGCQRGLTCPHGPSLVRTERTGSARLVGGGSKRMFYCRRQCMVSVYGVSARRSVYSVSVQSVYGVSVWCQCSAIGARRSVYSDQCTASVYDQCTASMYGVSVRRHARQSVHGDQCTASVYDQCTASVYSVSAQRSVYGNQCTASVYQ